MFSNSRMGHLPLALLYQGRNGPFASCVAIPGKKSFRKKSFLKLFFPCAMQKCEPGNAMGAIHVLCPSLSWDPSSFLVGHHFTLVFPVYFPVT